MRETENYRLNIAEENDVVDIVKISENFEKLDEELEKKVRGEEEKVRAGKESEASGERSVAIGHHASASGWESIAVGEYASASGAYATAIGSGASARNENTVAIGKSINATSKNATGIGNIIEITGNYGTAIGWNTKASGGCTNAIGYSAKASSWNSNAIGGHTEARGDSASAIGYNTLANSGASSAIGFKARTNGYGSSAIGYYTTANYQYETVIGRYNKVESGVENSTGNLLTIGNGTDESRRSNAFRVTHSGATYAGGAYNTAGADFAEYFEWSDGNEVFEDRVGHFVTLDGDKIRIANGKEEYILGVVSGTASVIGNAQEDEWGKKYVYDEWGRLNFEDITIAAKYEEIDGEEVLVEEERRIRTMMINPEYNEKKVYIPRSKRPEWDTVGLLGQMLVKDDGSCKVGGYCKCSDGGIATNSDSGGYKVMNRKSENIIKIMFR